ncbi:MAG: phage tail family protein, partial [Bacteroidales bacterium]|nr:phage tail family protein [Bacteroidales bacterium]
MYRLKFVKSTGDIFYFDVAHRILMDATPLSELDVNISTSQGFSQVGTTVENRSVDGVEREITGRIIGWANDIKEQMLHIFTPFSEGKLYFNDKYYCDCIVRTTPAIGSPKRDVGFAIILYCAYPYWMYAEETNVFMNTWTPCFRFPGPSSAIGTNYDSHCFGIKNESAFVNIYNEGEVDTTFDITFTTDSETYTNYGIVNVYTLEYIQINDTLSFGETTRIYRDGANLKVEKTLADGTVQDIFSLLDEDSTLFYLHPG